MTTTESTITSSEEHLIETLNRVRSQNKARRIWLWFRYLPAALFCFICYLAIHSHDYFDAILMATLAFSCFFPSKIDEYIMKRNLRRSPLFGDTYKVSLSDDGCAIVSANENTIMKWVALKGAVVFDDGVLLHLQNKLHCWLPKNSFATSDDFLAAVELVVSNTHTKHAG